MLLVRRFMHDFPLLSFLIFLLDTFCFINSSLLHFSTSSGQKDCKNFSAHFMLDVHSDSLLWFSLDVLGWDASGIVESVGAEVKHYKVGDEVYFAGSLTREGCFSEYCLVDERYEQDLSLWSFLCPAISHQHELNENLFSLHVKNCWS